MSNALSCLCQDGTRLTVKKTGECGAVSAIPYKRAYHHHMEVSNQKVEEGKEQYILEYLPKLINNTPWSESS